jgi:hypothetical protein
MWICGQPLPRLPTSSTTQAQNQKRTTDVLQKPVNYECYRHTGLVEALDASIAENRDTYGWPQ